MRFTTRCPTSLSALVVPFIFCLPTCQAVQPQAISVPFGPDFLGYDGLWSPAQIRVGSPEQWLLVFPSTTSAETWVAGPSLCTDPTCASLRGGIFYADNSTSWRSLGEYGLDFSALTETTQDGTYGLDNIAISDTLSAANQILAIVDTVQQWNGHLGLGVTETRFTNDTNYLPLISTLVQNNSAIPSHSYSYTAGASYKGSGVAGSLTLGGVDTSRYTSNGVWFSLADGNVPTAALVSMQVSASSQTTNWSTNPLELLPQSQAAMYTIDSSTPFLWLPESVCDNIAQALSLSWDPDLELYLLASGTAQNRVDMGLNFTFNFAKSVGSGETLALHVSYDAFNLQLSYPYPGLSSNLSDEKLAYFPLRRANNTLQYTIGRAFLQEIYMIVQYESNNFALAQALFPDSSQASQLVEISRPPDSVWPGPVNSSKSSGMSTAAKVGIAVAALVLVATVAAFFWFCCMRKRRHAGNDRGTSGHKSSIFSMFSKRSTRKSSISPSAAELVADKLHPTEMNSDASTSRYELSATTPIEMAAADVAPAFFQERSSNAIIPQRNDPRSPVELTQSPPRNSMSKDAARILVTEEEPRSAAPAYRPTEIDERHSNSHSSSGNGISPYSARRSGELFRGGSDHLISPITGNGSDQDRLSAGHLSQTESDSTKLLSAVSQARTRGGGQTPPHLASHHDNQRSIQGGTGRQTLSPTPDAASQPRRSTSRDSRFREVLVDDDMVQTGTTQSQTSRTDTRKPSRFSWET